MYVHCIMYCVNSCLANLFVFWRVPIFPIWHTLHDKKPKNDVTLIGHIITNDLIISLLSVL